VGTKEKAAVTDLYLTGYSPALCRLKKLKMPNSPVFNQVGKVPEISSDCVTEELL